MRQDYSFSLVTSDDFENPNSSPVPHYDRLWRHPAEIADSARSQHLGPTPPLGRRLTALTVIASVLASVAVLTVAIPKGIEEYTQLVPEPTVVTTAPRVKGAVQSSLAVLRGVHGTTSALSLGGNQWLVSTEALAQKQSSTLSAEKYSVVRSDESLGLAVIRSTSGGAAPAINVTHFKKRLTSEELSKYQILDAFQEHDVSPEPSISLQNTIDVHPVNMTNAIKGLAVVLDSDGHLVGLLVRRGHAQWSVTRRAFLSLATP